MPIWTLGVPAVLVGQTAFEQLKLCLSETSETLQTDLAEASLLSPAYPEPCLAC